MDENKIRERAYFKWLDAGCPANCESRFWEEAKNELCGWSDSDDGGSDD